jgi:hypothetical protein
MRNGCAPHTLDHFDNKRKKGHRIELWDGIAAERIVDIFTQMN